MSKEFQGGDINAVLRLVKSLTEDGDCQLSILTMALVVACRSCKVDKERAMEIINETFDAEHKLVPLESAAGDRLIEMRCRVVNREGDLKWLATHHHTDAAWFGRRRVSFIIRRPARCR